jgi:hypothetical protein
MGRGCKTGINDIATLRPDIAQGMIRYNNFYNIKEENNPNKISVSGSAIIHYRCPNGHDTHKIANKFSQLKQVDGLVVCPECKRLGITKIPYIPRNLVRTYLIDFCNDNPEYKHLLDEWDYEKNNENNIHIEKMGKGSHDKVWWKCPNCGISYDMSVSDRTEKAAKNNCPYCQRGRRVKTGHNDLATLYPHIAEEWDYDKNPSTISPSTIRAHSSIDKVWWKCKNGHSWDATPAKRTSKTNPTGCPKCKKHGTSRVETILYMFLEEKFANVLHREKLWNLEYDIVLPEEKILIEYNGLYAHSKPGKKERDFKKVLAAQDTEYRFLRIVETLNKDLFDNNIYSYNKEESILFVNANHNTKYFELCKELAKTLNTYFKCNISNTVNAEIIQIANEEMQIEQLENSLATTHPLLASMWHPTKNGNITPQTQSRGSRYNAWWKCPICGEEFQKVVRLMADKKVRFKCKNKCEEMYI